MSIPAYVNPHHVSSPNLYSTICPRRWGGYPWDWLNLTEAGLHTRPGISKEAVTFPWDLATCYHYPAWILSPQSPSSQGLLSSYAHLRSPRMVPVFNRQCTRNQQLKQRLESPHGSQLLRSNDGWPTAQSRFLLSTLSSPYSPAQIP
jgi:hypothetical protein